MPAPDLDWTFDSIPASSDDPAPLRPPPAAHRPGPARDQRRRPRARWLAGLLGVLLVVAAGAYLVYAHGWRRVEQQLAQEVAYEDDLSLAANAGAVEALQWPDNPAWVQARGAEAALGWPARPPADDLLPIAEPGRVLDVNPLAAGQLSATVLRTVADAAGRTYAFEYVQHYRSVGPGLWQRLAPADLAPADQAATTLWTGRRLTVTLPVADEPWLAPILPQLDHYLVRACADWQCPADLVVPLTFSGRLTELPGLAPPRRAEPPAAQAYPITFDLQFRTPRYPRRLILPALYLAGRPHDAAAQAALVRSTTVSLLAYVAGELSGTARTSRGDYLDALIARAEIRLGLSPAPAWSPHPDTYLPPESLWPYSAIGESRARRPSIVARLQALAFLDWALAGRPPSDEAALLKGLRFQPRLDDWLSDTLQVDGADLVEQWMAKTTAEFAAASPPRWDELAGLAYVCDDGAWLVRGGLPVPLPVRGAGAWLPRDALSPTGEYLVVVEAGESTAAQLRVLNLFDGTAAVVATEGLGLALGWSPASELLYLTQADGPFSPGFSYELRLYNPRTGQVLSLSAEPLVTPWGREQSWSADHSLLAVTLVQSAGPARGQISVSPGIISLKPPLQALRLPVSGYAAALSPDGQRLAYVSGQVSPEDWSSQSRGIDILNLTTQAVHGLLAPGLAGQPAFHDLNSLVWSPDGRQLAFLDYEVNAGVRLYVLAFQASDPAAGGDLQALLGPVPQLGLPGFSADSRYLAAEYYDQLRSEVLVFDTHTGQFSRHLGGQAARPWSPRGHQLALAGPGGVYVLDPATGAAQWVRRGACRVSWFELP